MVLSFIAVVVAAVLVVAATVAVAVVLLLLLLLPLLLTLSFMSSPPAYFRLLQLHVAFNCLMAIVDVRPQPITATTTKQPS